MIVTSHSLETVAEKIEKANEIKEFEEVIRRLIGFILRNSECFPQDNMMEQLKNSFLDTSNKPEDKPRDKTKNVGQMYDHLMKRSEKDSKRRYKDDIGTILYIGKRGDF